MFAFFFIRESNMAANLGFLTGRNHGSTPSGAFASASSASAIT